MCSATWPASSTRPCTACSASATSWTSRRLARYRRLDEYWIRQPDDPFRSYAIKWDGEWQITYETFRDMGAAYGVGLILIYLLVVAQFKSTARR
jgi:multidrug efflux pump subunit AcrB